MNIKYEVIENGVVHHDTLTDYDIAVAKAKNIALETNHKMTVEKVTREVVHQVIID